MSALESYGFVAVATIGIMFYAVRKIPAYVALCGLIVLLFAVVTFRMIALQGPSEWIVMTLGLAAASFGLLIVRVMLIRSVSLRLLRCVETSEPSTFGDDLGGRLGDMRSFNLIRTTDGENVLTPFGRMVSGIVAGLYSIFRMGA